MKQVVAVRKWGQSVAVALPSPIAKELGWTVRDVLHVDIQGDALVLQRVTMPKARALAPAPEAAAPEARR
jgi:antitoxin component of MazEF toxin-antitoxin module